MEDWKAKQAARAVAAAALQAANPHLVPVSEKNNRLIAASKNMRIELARAFPGVKFSVKSSRFSMGDDIRVSWIDGPNRDQVEKIVDRYSAGSFDGMQDLYSYEENAWRDAFGDAKYVFAERSFSDQAIAAAARYVAAKFGVEAPSVADYRAGKCRSWQANGALDLQDLIYQAAAKKTYALDKSPKPAPMVEAQGVAA